MLSPLIKSALPACISSAIINVALPPGKKSVGWRWTSDPNHPANRPAQTHK